MGVWHYLAEWHLMKKDVQGSASVHPRDHTQLLGTFNFTNGRFWLRVSRELRRELGSFVRFLILNHVFFEVTKANGVIFKFMNLDAKAGHLQIH